MSGLRLWKRPDFRSERAKSAMPSNGRNNQKSGKQKTFLIRKHEAKMQGDSERMVKTQGKVNKAN